MAGEIAGVQFDHNQRIQLADIKVTPGSSLVNETLLTKGPEMSDLIIVAIKKNDGSFLFFPKADYKFNEGDYLVAMGTQKAYEDALNTFHITS